MAPIALYPDSPLAQIVAASTFPEQVVEAARWVQAHSDVFRHLEQHRKQLVVNLAQLSKALRSMIDTWLRSACIAGGSAYESRPIMPETFAVLLLAVWAGAIVVLVNVERADKLLWIPVVLAVAGMFSAILPLAIPFYISVVANGAT